MRRAALVVLFACSSAPAPLAPRPVVVIAPPPGTPLEPHCEDDDIVAIARPVAAALVCSLDYKHCQARVPLALRNCTGDAVDVDGMVTDSVMQCLDSRDLVQPLRLARGETRTISLDATKSGSFDARFVVTYRDPARGPMTMYGGVGTSLVITNPLLDHARAACIACNGDWGYHYMMRTIELCNDPDQGYDCNCRTHDVNHPCSDSDDCEGWCEADHFEQTGTRNGVAIGYERGRCSEFTDQHSCTSEIPHGASKQPPGPHVEHRRCAD